MQKIEINTTQNVSIEFEAAPLGERIGAFLLDILILSASSTVITLALSSLINPVTIAYFIVIPLFLLYPLLFETLNNGQTPGKLIMKLKVVKLNGSEPGSSDYMLRWAFGIFDFYSSFGALAAIFISSSDKNQRLGDLAAETTVIRIKPSKALVFSDIIRINSIDNYEPKFPEVKKLTENNMLLIKNVLDRYKSFPNDAHREAIQMLVNKVKEQTNIDQGTMPNVAFLKQLINDYVVLTR